MSHSPAFLALVNDARTRIREIPAAALTTYLASHPQARLIDVREESEYVTGHIRGAEWLGKGIVERDIETRVPDKTTVLYLYCGGGFRSALVADNLQKMGYTQVTSVDGGWKQLKDLLPHT